MIEKIFNKNMASLDTIKNDASQFILKFKFDSLKIFLILVYATLYLPHCFILNEDLGLMIAHSTDAGTICEAIMGLLDNYNFHDYMHSRYYGWTYFFINFIFLKPVKIFLDLFGYSNNTETLLFCIKLLFFTIGLLSVIAFNEVLLKIFRNNFYALLGSMLYVVGGASRIFYNIHPETTGLLFMFLSILSLLNFLENPNRYKYYIYGLAFLALSSLSKQIFFFTSLPILAIFITIIFINEKISFRDFIASRKFIDLTKHSLLVTFITLLIINPFLIFDFKNAFEYQTDLLNHHNKKSTLGILSTRELFSTWLIILGSLPIIFLYFVSVIFTYIVTIYNISKKRTAENMLFLTMIISIYLIFVLIFVGNSLYVIPLYLTPIYPFCIIYALVLIRYFKSKGGCKKVELAKAVVSFLISIFCAIALLRYVHITTVTSFDKLLGHKKTMAYESYKYISENFDENDKIIYGPFVAIPKSISKNSCNYWLDRDCLATILDPDYIMIVEDFVTNGKKSIGLRKAINYIKENDMRLVKEIYDYRYDNDTRISIYKNTK